MAARKYGKLFEPIKIGKIEVKNRIAMAPMGVSGLSTIEGCFSQRAVDYYVERAIGGTGLIITSLVKVENEIEKRPMPSLPCITVSPGHFIQTASEMTERIHAYGAKIFIQLTGGFGRVARPMGHLSPPIAPSAVPNYWDPGITCRELTTEEVEKLVQAFGKAAKVAVAAGFDGIDIHAVHEGYLIDQFTIALFNRRTDKYGGDLKGRLTLPVEIVKEIKKAVGADYPVQLRFSIKSYIKDWRQGGLPGEDFKELGRDTGEGLEAAKILESAGYDAFNADAGSYDAWYWAHPPLYQEHGCYLPLTLKLKEAVKVPVIVAGRMELPELAVSAIDEGKADMVALGRGLLAEPYWPAKVLGGKAERIRPCLACHDGCFQRLATMRPLSCAVNPVCGRERDYAIQPAAGKKSVMVIGGGVAGMEAARVAAIRKHRVALFEKGDKLGGHLIEGSVPGFKKEVARLLEWYKTELSELGVEVHLSSEVLPGMVSKEKADALVVATGSQWCIPEISGCDKAGVATASAVLLGKKKAEEPVVIIGGGLTGCETALWLAQQGKKVTIVEMLNELMCGGIPVHHANRMMLIDLLKLHQVKVLNNTTPLEIQDGSVILINRNFHKTTLEAGSVVLATGLKSEQRLFRSIGSKLANIYLIGDARQPGNIMSAIWDAYEIGRNI